MTDSAPKNQLDVDNDWKEQAEREKERLSQAKTPPAPATATAQAIPPAAESPKSSPTAPPERRLPPASFELMVEQYATQVLFALGAIPHPSTGERSKDMEVAKHYIDLLAVLGRKNQGQPDQRRRRHAQHRRLYQMRMNYTSTPPAPR